MKNKFHGVFSFILLLIALGLASYALIQQSYLGWLYIPIIVFSFIAIAGIFCTKCSAAPYNCSHVFVGYLTKLFPKRKKSSYKSWEYIVIAIILIILIGIPQFWLWKHTSFFIVFWSLSAIAGLEINAFVCKKCKNKNCAMCKS